MPVITYEDVNPTLIENTTMRGVLRDGELRSYSITPNAGYVLHDNARDEIWYDEDTMEETLLLGYTRGMATCLANYDFDENPREFYAVLETEVPADQIFGLPDNDHEVM